MKKLMALFAISIMTLVVGCSDNNIPKEGKQYKQLPVTLSSYQLPQVTEVFSLNCSHCVNLETAMPQLETLTKQSIGKLHVTFNESAQVGAMIYYSADMQLGNTPDHEFMKDLFGAVQMEEGTTLSEKKAAVDNAFQSRGLVSPYDLDKKQQEELFQMMNLAQDITQKGQMNAVPTFIVNGKYMVLLPGHQNIADIANTINYLTTQP